MGYDFPSNLRVFRSLTAAPLTPDTSVNRANYVMKSELKSVSNRING